MRNRTLLTIVLLVPVILMAQFKKEAARVKPVVLSFDPAIFQPNAFWIDTRDKLSLSYDGINGLEFDFALLRKNGAPLELFIEEPSYIRIEGVGSQLIYPGEHIAIKFNSDQSALLFYSPTSAGRTKDFAIAVAFADAASLVGRSVYNDNQYMPSTSEKDFIQLKGEFTATVEQAAARKRVLLDSLLRSYNAGKEIRLAMNNKIIADSLMSMYSFLEQYRGDLIKYGLFNDHLLQFTRGLGKTIRNDGPIMQMKYELLRLIGFALKSKGINDELKNEQDYNNYKNVIDSFFTGPVRAFLWSTVMVDCIENNIPLSSETINAYKGDASNGGYKNIVEAKLMLRERRNSVAVKPGTTRLLSLTSDKETTMESLLEKYKGKLVLINFWHSMYTPSREQLPYLFDLQKELKDKVEFINISFEDSYSNWIRASKTESIESERSYLLVNGRKTDLSAYKLRTAVRYLLIGKDGSILDADAPKPSDKKLKELIQQHL